MAFGNNYAYNPYINPYASPYNPQPQPMMQNFQQQQQPMPQIQQTAQQSQQNIFISVDGIEEVNRFYVAPNCAVDFIDKNLPCLYKKTSDASGRTNVEVFDLFKRETENPHQKPSEADLSDFVKRDEITHLEERIAKLEGLSAKQRAKGDNVDG